jgi:hypothetical protein
MSDKYLIWSNKHERWWGPNRSGYVNRVADAGRYNHIEVIDICTDSMAGTMQSISKFPNLPVKLLDVMLMLRFYRRMYPGQDPEDFLRARDQ